MSKTIYRNFGLNLSEDQIAKIKNAGKSGAIVIRLKKENLNGEHKLPLTNTQIKRIQNAKGGLDLKLSSAQLNHIKTGGFLPLLAALPLIFGGLGAAGGVAGGVSAAVTAAKNAQAQAAAQKEMERHNREVEAQMKAGSGISGKMSTICKCLKPILAKEGLGMCKFGNGLFIGPQSASGNGLFLGPERQ